MSDQLSMFGQTICAGLSSAIFLQAEDCGASRQGSPDGPTTPRSGRAPARASRSASPGKGSGAMIRGICDPTFTGSLPPEGRMSLLASRLVARLATIGSTERALIWSAKATPAKRLIFRLAPSMRLTKEIASTGSRLEMWTTASARDWKDSAGMATTGPGGRIRLDQLPRQMVAHNPTPTVADVQGGRKARSGARANEPLLNGLLTSYATELTGLMPNGSSVRSTAGRGAPNPAFAFWLMGFPDEWTSGALAAMQSFRSSRRKSSPRSKTR